MISSGRSQPASAPVSVIAHVRAVGKPASELDEAAGIVRRSRARSASGWMANVEIHPWIGPLQPARSSVSDSVHGTCTSSRHRPRRRGEPGLGPRRVRRPAAGDDVRRGLPPPGVASSSTGPPLCSTTLIRSCPCAAASSTARRTVLGSCHLAHRPGRSPGSSRRVPTNRGQECTSDLDQATCR
jgi:hypothetical protein